MPAAKHRYFAPRAILTLPWNDLYIYSLRAVSARHIVTVSVSLLPPHPVHINHIVMFIVFISQGLSLLLLPLPLPLLLGRVGRVDVVTLASAGVVVVLAAVIVPSIVLMTSRRSLSGTTTAIHKPPSRPPPPLLDRSHGRSLVPPPPRLQHLHSCLILKSPQPVLVLVLQRQLRRVKRVAKVGCSWLDTHTDTY